MNKILVLLVLMVVNVWAVDVVKLQKAHKEALKIYQNSKNVYKPIKMMKKVGITSLIKQKPKALVSEEYSKILYTYANYLLHTNEDSYHGKNLHQAIKSLKQALKHFPGNPDYHLLLGQTYLKLFKFSKSTALIPSHFIQFDAAYDESWTTISPDMKSAYVNYVKLCKENNVKPKLTREEKVIVKKNQMFIVYDNTFSGKKSWWPRNPQPKKYKVGFENICQEYVDMLNHLPDDELMRCSRYDNRASLLFTFTGTSKEHPVFKTVGFHFFKYKELQFSDSFYGLRLKDDKGKNKRKKIIHACGYQYVNFRKKHQKKVGKSCSSIPNYLTKYKLKK